MVHDILNVAHRRYPNMQFEITPVKVQGKDAIPQIIQAFDILNNHSGCDVIILARGGGSLEDLQAFNCERVAHAIFASEIPVISAIGHETDFTISDFVSDLRAPTPSAAAEIAVPVKSELIKNISYLRENLYQRINALVRQKRLDVDRATKSLRHPKNKIQDLLYRIDDYALRLAQSMKRNLKYKKERIENQSQRLTDHNPKSITYKLKVEIEKMSDNLQISMLNKLSENRHLLRGLTSSIEALNPRAILKRGYSITRSLPEYGVVREPDDVSIQQQVEVMVSKGNLICRVERISKDG